MSNELVMLEQYEELQERIAELEGELDTAKAERDFAREQAGKTFEQVNTEIREAYQAMQAEHDQLLEYTRLALGRRDVHSVYEALDFLNCQLAEERARSDAARKRLGDLKAVHATWYDGTGTRTEREVITEMEHIAYSVICYLDGVPGLYLNPAAIDAAREG